MADLLIAKETTEGETRVAAVPETVKKLCKAGFRVRVEAGAGLGASVLDSAYIEAGAEMLSGAQTDAAWAEADVIAAVHAPPSDKAAIIKSGALLVASMAPHRHAALVAALRDRQVSTLAMELVPRISRAQSMDALSSQASIAGYKAVLLAAVALDKYFPLLMTAAGTVQPARVVVMGAGVAGLQCVATAKRLGAIVEVSDIRPAVKEQVESLGGKFIDLPLEESGEGQGGYAKEVTPEFLRKQQAIVAKRVQAADVVITTALVPGRPAPKLVTREMVEAMRPGAVIVDLAVEQGGNCELSKAGETVVHQGVQIIGAGNLAASMPADASALYARNVLALLTHVSKDGAVQLDLEDEIVQGALLTHQGEVRHEPTRKAIESGV